MRIHLLPEIDKFVLDSAANVEVELAVPELALKEVASFLAVLAQVAPESFAVLVDFSTKFGVFGVGIPHFWHPIYAGDVSPTLVGASNDALQVRAKHALD